jgi:arylsulfatase A-like enzyme
MKKAKRNTKNYAKIAKASLTGTALLAACTLPAAGAPAAKPNILFILLDDMGWYEPGCYGGTTGLETPNIDRLAREGMRFTQFTSYPMCSPSRAAFVTGRHGYRTGIVSNVCDPGGAGHEFFSEEIPFAKTLKKAGYTTACYGKLHLHWDNSVHPEFVSDVLGFDHSMVYIGHPYEELRNRKIPNDRKLSDPAGGMVFDHFNLTWSQDGKPVNSEGYDSDVLTQAAIEFMKQKREQPFAVWLPYFSIHEPFQAPPRWKSYWDDRKEKLRPIFEECVRRTRAVAAMPGGRKELVNYNPPLDMFINRTAMASSVDENIGRLLDYLDASGLADNTLVVFSSDNGPHPIAGGGKATVCDDAVRLPLIVRWPGRIAPGTVCDALTESVDIYPTLVDAAGERMPSEIPFDGASLIPLLEGRTPESWRQAGYTELRGVYGIFTTDWFMRSDPGQKPVFYARQTPPTILEHPVDEEIVPLDVRKLLISKDEKLRKISKETITKIQHEMNACRKQGYGVYSDRLIDMGLQKK